MSNFASMVRNMEGFATGAIKTHAFDGTYGAETGMMLDRADLDILKNEARCFVVDRPLAVAMEMTDNVPRPMRLPFKAVFVDGQFYHEPSKTMFHGLLLYENAPPASDGLCHNVVFRSVGFENGPDNAISTIRGNVLTHFEGVERIKDGDEFDWDFEDVQDFLARVAANFVDLLSEPEIVFQQVRDGPNARQRFVRDNDGIEPPISTQRIVLRGKIKADVQAISTATKGGSVKFNHRWWVRGHWRHLGAPRFNPPRRVWIRPFVKGKGILVSKDYDVRVDEPTKQVPRAVGQAIENVKVEHLEG